MKKTLAALTIFLLSHTCAYAAPATPEEAKRLTELFQSYMGEAADAVKVVPLGDAYTVTLDVDGLVKKAQETASADGSKMQIKISPFAFTLTPKGDGKWLLAQDMPLDWSFTEPGKTAMTVKSDSMKTTGVFDEKLMVFSTYQSDIVNFAGTIQDQSADAKNQPKLNYKIANLHAQGDAKATGVGVFDGAYDVSINDVSASMEAMPQPDGGTPISGAVTLAKLGYNISMTGVKGQAFLNMFKWALALPPEQQGKDAKLTDAQQSELKTLVLAALPFFQKINITYSLDKLAVTSPFGNAGLEKAAVTVELSGAVKDGFFREAILLSGLTTPQGIFPPWSDPLMPDKFGLDFKISNLDFEGVTKLAMDEPAILDSTAEGDVKAANDAKLLKAIIPSGAATLTIKDGKLAGKTYDLDYEGTVSGGPEVPPTGKGTIRAKDLIALITALQALPPELGMAQASPAIIAFNSMAKKQSDGTLLWELDGEAVGKFLINGVDFMSLMALGGVSVPEPDEAQNPDATSDGAVTDGTDDEAKDPEKVE